MSAASAHDRLARGQHAEFVRILADSKPGPAARRRPRAAALAALNLNALLIFAKVAEANSFSEGARRLRIPISTVSRQVADLEMQLGVRLLERSTRRLRLTDIGAEVLEEARVATGISESILGLVSYRSSSVSGLLRISAPPRITKSLVIPLVGVFQSSFPDVRVQMHSSDLSPDLIASDLDVLFKVGPINDSSQIYRRLLTFRDRLVASPAYLSLRNAPETPSELPTHQLLALSSGEPKIEWRFTNSGHRDSVALVVEPYLSVNDPASLIAALLAGMGIGNLPSMAIGDLIEEGRLIELMPQWRFCTLDVAVVHASRRHVRRTVQEFIRIAAKLAPALFRPSQGIDSPTRNRNGTPLFDAVAIL